MVLNYKDIAMGTNSNEEITNESQSNPFTEELVLTKILEKINLVKKFYNIL